MKLLVNSIIALVNKFILRKSNGYTVKIFCNNMGFAYIKLAQILAMQDIEGLFTEEDREDLANICDDCNRISYKHIKNIVIQEYGKDYKKIFKKIHKEPVGSASISQVHRATLFNGDKVVIKVKRQDIANTADKDVRVILFLSKTLGRLMGVTNNIGVKTALKFYKQWLKEELDFENEVKNIQSYSEFAKSVNGRVKGCTNIVVPKVYTDLCTKNIIVMEYIPYPTINKIVDRDKLIKGINSYIQLSFYALLNNKRIVFHGDPHAGNIYITDNGDIGFLDMGLIFDLNEKDAEDTKKLFFDAYFGKYSSLYKTLLPYFDGNKKQKESFKNDIKDYCNSIMTRPVTAFFMDMVLVCFKYNIAPPDFLYGMAKAFACLGGMDTVYKNDITGHQLLVSQVMEYITTQIINEGKTVLGASRDLFRGILTDNDNDINNGLVKYLNIYKNIRKWRA